MNDYINETVAVGIMMINSEGYDEMAVFHGVIKENGSGLLLETDGQEPMEMSNKWLEKLKPVEESMDEQFQGSKYCLIIAMPKVAN
jgi:hypothetical protein